MADKSSSRTLNRRGVLKRLGGAALLSTPLSTLASTDTSEGVTFAAGPRPLIQYPGKRPLIRVHTRPPHLETPFAVFDEGAITPNDAFFVRYHLADFPLSIAPGQYRLTISGHVNKAMSLSLDELKALATPQEVVAVNQCSGNSRGFAKPRVFGAQLGNGAMGNARWVGVPLRDVLHRAGVRAGATVVTFNGLDKPVLASTPDFRKSLDIDHALSDEPILAWSMNGEDIPFLNGYPLKLIVPGYFGTYWVKHLSEIEVLDTAFEGRDAFFMNTAYRLPDNPCHCVTPGSEAAQTLPIAELPVRSFITNVHHGAELAAGEAHTLRGIAFDGGSGIKRVELSVDGGLTWRQAQLGENLGRFSFRQWQLNLPLPAAGAGLLMVRAFNNRGETQPESATWNHGGYRRSAIERTVISLV